MAYSLRLATADDASAIAAIYAPVVRDTAISFEATAPDAPEFARRIAGVLTRLPWLVLTDGETLLGYAYCQPYKERDSYKWTIESSVYLAEAGRGRGVASALYTALFALVEAQGYCSVAAGITLPNAASVKLHERFGFRPIGVYEGAGYKHGAWHDVGSWRRPIRPTDAAPPALVPIGALVGGPVWEQAIAAGLAVLTRP